MTDNKNPMGKNNFAKLETANILGPKTLSAEEVQARLEKRLSNLQNAHKGLTGVYAATLKLYNMDKKKQLALLAKAITFVESVATKLKGTQGLKPPLSKCMNELVSLREGIYTGAATDKKALAVYASKSALDEIQDLITGVQARIETNAASLDPEEIFRRAGKVIEDNKHETQKLETLNNKQFSLVRVPIIPGDGNASVMKLKAQGFKVDDIAGYPVLHNQLAVGLNPKRVLGEGGAKGKSEKISKTLSQEVDRIRKILEQQLKIKLYLVSTQAYRANGGSWYWLMSAAELKRFAHAFPGGQVKVKDWGFGFRVDKEKVAKEAE